jgi:hypothetical protein
MKNEKNGKKIGRKKIAVKSTFFGKDTFHNKMENKNNKIE